MPKTETIRVQASVRLCGTESRPEIMVPFTFQAEPEQVYDLLRQFHPRLGLIGTLLATAGGGWC